MKPFVKSFVSAWGAFRSWAKGIVCPSTDYPVQVGANGVADIDTAIAATGFGRYNLLLMLFAIPAGVASIFDTTTMSYVLPSAECDLQLTPVDKGLLNAITHLGMISGAFISGYLTDTLGRKKVLIIGFLLDAVVNFIAAFSVNFSMLLSMKFFSGFLMCGPCTVIISCLTEFFSAPLRPMITMYIGIWFAFGNFSLPFIAWSLLEHPYNMFISPTLVIHSWQVFIAVCCLPSLISGLLSIMLPESPRFLLSRGRKKEALQVLSNVYAMNNKSSPYMYPVKELKVAEDPEGVANKNVGDKKETTLSALKSGFKQILPLFLPPYLWTIILIIILEFCCFAG